jgi:hypothetical protein
LKIKNQNCTEDLGWTQFNMQIDPAIFLLPEDSPPDAKDKTPGERQMPRSCSVASGLGERVIDVLVVPPVHLHPLSLKVRSRDVR